MKNHLKLIKLLSLMAVLALFSSACLIGGAQPAATLSPQQVEDTAVALTITAFPTIIPSKTAVPPLPTNTLLPLKADTLSFTPTPTWTPAQGGTPTPVGLLPAGAVIEGVKCIPTSSHQDLAIVLKVIDGDTIQVIVNGKTEIVSYIGVSTPALPSGSKPGGRLAQEAFQKNKSLVDGKVVVLIKDTTEADAAGHLLRYVLTDTFFANFELVKQGLAVALAVPPDVACRASFDAIQQAAMVQAIGVWQPTPTSTARPNHLPSLTPTFKKSDH